MVWCNIFINFFADDIIFLCDCIKMASNVNRLKSIQKEIKDLEILHDALCVVEWKITVGTNMSPAGYNVMYLTHVWLKKTLATLKQECHELSNEKLI